MVTDDSVNPPVHVTGDGLFAPYSLFPRRSRSGCYPVAIRLLSLRGLEVASVESRIRIWLRDRDSNPEPCG